MQRDRGQQQDVPLLECRDLTVRTGARALVEGVSLHIDPGEAYGLLGSADSGKTTIVSLVCGLRRRDGGSVMVAGQPMDVGSVRARAAVGYVPQEPALYPDLSARENVHFFGQLQGLAGPSLRARVDEVLEQMGLREHGGERVSGYATGLGRRLSLAVGLVHRPRLLVLDDPVGGADPRSREAILGCITEVTASGTAILYASREADQVERVCGRVGILAEGRLRAEGTPRELLALVGRRQRLTLLARGDLRAAATALAALDGVTATAVRDGRLEAVVDDVDRLMPTLIATVTASGGAVRRVDVDSPDLGAVALHVTGRALRG